jgi:hypothetical protein
MKHAWSAGEAWGKSSAALIGGALLFLDVLIGVGVMLVRAGASPNVAAFAAVWLAFLAWPVMAVIVLLARDARRAWLGTAVALALTAAGMLAARLL